MLWKAIALSKTIGTSGRVLDAAVIKEIHRAILGDAMPSVVGGDIKKLVCNEPLPGSAVFEKMHLFEEDLVHRVSLISRRPGRSTGKRYWPPGCSTPWWRFIHSVKATDASPDS